MKTHSLPRVISSFYPLVGLLLVFILVFQLSGPIFIPVQAQNETETIEEPVLSDNLVSDKLPQADNLTTDMPTESDNLTSGIPPGDSFTSETPHQSDNASLERWITRYGWY